MEPRSAQRISFSLSEEAYATIESDMDMFLNKRNFDGFINRIITNFRETSDASISLAIIREREKLISWSGSDSPLIDKLIEGYTEELVEKMRSFPNGKTVKPRINNDNYDDLCMGTRNFPEDLYYDHREGKYIKALLEDYSNQSFIFREGIYFKDIIDDINYAIQNNKTIKINYTNMRQETKTITVRPIKVVESSLPSYHYLIAFPGERDGDPFPLRISRIEHVRITSRSAHITKDIKADIDKLIQKKGILFLDPNSTEIKIRLTPQGHKMYKSILHLRPKTEIIEPDGENIIMTLSCSEEQVKKYFFQFGKEAKIVNPSHLSEWFCNEHYQAHKVYKTR